jgi:hypothetical protein
LIRSFAALRLRFSPRRAFVGRAFRTLFDCALVRGRFTRKLMNESEPQNSSAAMGFGKLLLICAVVMAIGIGLIKALMYLTG